MWIGAIAFAVPFLLLLLIGHGANIIAQCLLPMTFALFIMAVYTIKGLVFFWTVNKFLLDESEWSIIPLFDEGYSIYLENADSKLFFTTEKLKGNIGGLPVVVSFPQLTRARWPTLVFNFYPLSQYDAEHKLYRKIDFKLDITRKLKQNIKPTVLSFVDELKLNGYTSVMSS
jgi:hypothetical protein